MKEKSKYSKNSMQSKQNPTKTKSYFLGLDMGTSSLGFAVTDRHYNVVRKRGRHLWGVRLFEEASTAAEARQFRTARRRNRREKERVKFVQEVFQDALDKQDPEFLQRLQDSFFYPEDKAIEQKYSLFNDPDFSDVDYHKKFPSIYHLRLHLMKTESPQDVRLVYLAIAHIMKNRGHFHYPGSSYDPEQQYESCYASFREACDNLLGDNSLPDIEEDLRKVLVQTGINRTTRSKSIQDLFEQSGYDLSKRQRTELAKLLSGLKCKFSTLFEDEELAEVDPKDCELVKDYDSQRPGIEEAIGSERIELIDAAHALYNWMRLSAILGDYTLLSEAKVASYEQHKIDLKRLKSIIKLCDKQEKLNPKNKKPYIYERIFNINKKALNNYVAYSGHYSKRGVKLELEYRNRSQSDFIKQIEKELKPFDEIPAVNELLVELEKGEFMPLIVGTDNSTIPRQIVGAELKLILSNARHYLDFLDADTCSKLEQMFEFRIPYYVGPLNPAHAHDKENGRFAWVVRKEAGKVYPWNFHEKVDEDKSAEAFIEKMTRDCSYLIKEKSLPKQSLLYSEYMLLNIVNAINIKGQRLDNNTRHQLIEDLFKSPDAPARVTRKRVLNWFKSNGLQVTDDELGGFDLDIPVQLTALRDYRKLASPSLDLDDMEKIVKTITLFPDDRVMIRRNLKKEYGDNISDNDLKFLSSRRYKDWGRLSEKFLSGIKGRSAKDYGKSIIEMMREEPILLMELLSSEYSFTEQIEEINRSLQPSTDKLSYEMLDDYIISPPVKRMIWQTLLVYQDIEKIMGGTPEKIFVEVARTDLEKGKRTQSRKDQLLDLYKACKKDTGNWAIELADKLEGENEKSLDSRRLFLYYMQQGRCAYSNEIIDINSLYTNTYDIDHIYPRSLTKDDSIHNNLVLVRADLNKEKGNRYPVPIGFQDDSQKLWQRLFSQGFITPEKYRRLTRITELSDEELAGFINRQLVETRQSIKVVTDILERVLGQQTRVVYVKAGHVSDFRYRDFRKTRYEPEKEDLVFVKCRELNDIHHAKDAYLNIVVGNVYDEKFTKNPRQFIAQAKRSDNQPHGYSLARLYDYNVPYRKQDQGLAWEAGSDGTIATVKKVMGRNDVLYTEQTIIRTGGLFDQQIIKASKVKTLQGKMPIKGGLTDNHKQNPYSNVMRYGAYNKTSIAHYSLVEVKEGKKTERHIEPVPLFVYQDAISEPQRKEEIYEEYMKSAFDTARVRIAIRELPFNSVLEINNYRQRIRGKTVNQFLSESHIQSFYSPKREIELSKIMNCSKMINISDYKKLSDEEKNKINKNCALSLKGLDLTEIADYLVTKFSEGPWKHSSHLKRISNRVSKKKDVFLRNSTFEQTVGIRQLVSLMSCHQQEFNLDCFELGSREGILRTNKKLKNDVDHLLITQSPSGFYENAIDLWKV